MKTLIITDRREEKDKNKNPYAVIEASTPSTVYTENSKGVKTPIKQKPVPIGGITGWEKSNLPSLKGKPDYEWTMEVGEEVAGDIVARRVTNLDGTRVFIADRTGDKAPKTPGPDKLDGKTGRYTDTVRVAVFANSEDEETFNMEVIRAFKRKGYLIVNATAAQKAEADQTPADPEKVDSEAQAKASK